MERQFYINWPAIIEEAKLRRKEQRLTQAHLAKMIGVSTPTISHFENGNMRMQLSTVINILSNLGMYDKRMLVFEKSHAWYDFKHEVIKFEGQNENEKVISIAMSAEALENFFKSVRNNENVKRYGDFLLKVFEVNRERIEHEARRKYLLGKFEADGSILLKATDL